jgi:hypothetical protein
MLPAMLPAIERGQSMDGALAWSVGVPLPGFCGLQNTPGDDFAIPVGRYSEAFDMPDRRPRLQRSSALDRATDFGKAD